MFFLDLDCLPLCISSTQYFCQWLHWLWQPLNNKNLISLNRPFPSSSGLLYQSEVRCSTFDMEMIFHSHANKTHYKKGWVPNLVVIQRPGELGNGLLWKTTLKYKNLFSVISKILGSYMRVFTVLHTAHVLSKSGKNDSNTLRMDAYFIKNGETNFRFSE